jgi:hypothetical protein
MSGRQRGGSLCWKGTGSLNAVLIPDFAALIRATSNKKAALAGGISFSITPHGDQITTTLVPTLTWS